MTRSEHPRRDRDRTSERDRGRLSTQRDLRYRDVLADSPGLPEVPPSCHQPPPPPLDKSPRPLTTRPWPGTAISRHRRVAIMTLPPRTPWLCTMSSPWAVAVSWCSQAAMVAASSAPHIHAVLTWGYPDGRCRRAAPSLLSRKMFSTVVRCRYQCSAAAALAELDTSRFVKMNE